MNRIISLLVIICILLTSCANRKVVSRNIDNYVSDCQSVKNASVLMPNLEDLGAYTELKYTYQVTCYSKFMGFYSDGLALFVKYERENYEEQKEHALNTYTFLSTPVMRSSDTFELPLTEFEYEGYLMKIVPDEDYINFCACKSFMMLGLNDDECVIAYLYYYDFDIDYIAEYDDDLNAEMVYLVNEAFTWISL